MNATTETKLYILCSLQSYLSYLESLHNPTKVMTLMTGTWCLPAWTDLIFYVRLDNSGGVGGWGNSWQWSICQHRVDSKTSTLQGPSFHGDRLWWCVWCIPVCWLTPNVVSLFFSFTLDSILGSVEQQLVKRIEHGKILNRFWLWSELYHGSWVILIVSLFKRLPHLRSCL